MWWRNSIVSLWFYPRQMSQVEEHVTLMKTHMKKSLAFAAVLKKSVILALLSDNFGLVFS